MPSRSRVRTLPPEIRAELDRRLVDAGFADYEALSAWLAERGHEISKSAVHRYGQQLEKRIEELLVSQRTAEALVKATDDSDSGAMAEGAMRLAERQMFECFLAAESRDLAELSKAARALAESTRAGVTIRDERRRIRAEASDAAASTARRRGVSEDVVAAIREAIEKD